MAGVDATGKSASCMCHKNQAYAFADAAANSLAENI